MKLTHLVIGFTCLSLFSSLANAETLAQAIEKCRVVDNTLNRLMCYDKLAQKAGNMEDSELQELYRQRAEMPCTAVPTATAPVQTAAPVESSDPADTFGIESRIAREKTEKISEISAIVGKVTQGANGKSVITLEDGQVWVQTDSVKRVKVSSGDSVIVSRGLMGGFFLQKSGNNTRMRVKRKK